MNWKEYTLFPAGLPVTARFSKENIEGIFLPLLQRLTAMQKEKNRRLIVFLAAPPGAGKSTLSLFLEELSKTRELTPLQALPLDGFHYHSDYIQSHTVTLPDGSTLPMAKVKGSPETFDVAHLADKLKVLQEESVLWPYYDRQKLHDVIEEHTPVTEKIVLVEGNWLLYRGGGWETVRSFADYTIFLFAEEVLVKERLLRRKIQGGLSREEAEEFYRTGDGVNVYRALCENDRGDLNLRLLSDGSFAPFIERRTPC